MLPSDSRPHVPCGPLQVVASATAALALGVGGPALADVPPGLMYDGSVVDMAEPQVRRRPPWPWPNTSDVAQKLLVLHATEKCLCIGVVFFMGGVVCVANVF